MKVSSDLTYLYFLWWCQQNWPDTKPPFKNIHAVHRDYKLYNLIEHLYSFVECLLVLIYIDISVYI